MALHRTRSDAMVVVRTGPGRFLGILFLLIAGLAAPAVTWAAPEVTWDGGGTDNNWTTPENWNTNEVPTILNTVIFDGTSSRNCLLDVNQDVYDFRMRVGYNGRLTITCTYFTVTGDFEQHAGTIDHQSSFRRFMRNYTRTGGTCISADALFQFEGSGTWTFTPGPGGVTARVFQVDSGATVDVFGDVTTGSNGFYNSGRVNLHGALTLTGIGGMVNNGTLEVLQGAVLDARQTEAYDNNGTIIETGTGRVLRLATAMAFTDSGGAPVTVVTIGTLTFVTLIDEDENLDGSVPDTTRVTITSLTTGDSETLTLTETGTRTETFRNTVGLATAAGTANPGDDILQQNGTEDLRVNYADNEDATDTLSVRLQQPALVWDGGGLGNDWNTAANWTGDRVPTEFDSVRFDGTSNKNCVVTVNNRQIIHMTVATGYTGTITVNPTYFTVTGNFLQEAGTINWQSSFRQFLGDCIRTGGTVVSADALFLFQGSGVQEFRPGPGGMVVRVLQVDSGTTNVRGDVTTGSNGLYNAATTNLYGTLTLGPGRFSNNGTMNVQNGSIADARTAPEYDNYGTVNQIGTGRVLRDAEAISFTDSTGDPISAIPVGSSFYVTLLDEDENWRGNTLDTATVTVSSLTTGDVESVMLTETGVRAELFRNAIGFPTAMGVAVPGDGVLQQDGIENIIVTYVDNEDPADATDDYLIAPPIVWDGGGADNDWDTPANWSTDRVPTRFDSVRFDGTSSRDCVVTTNLPVEIIDFTMTPDYRGLLRITNTYFKCTGDVLQQGGTIDWASSFRQFLGNFTRTGGGTSISADALFQFEKAGEQTFDPGPGGMIVRVLQSDYGTTLDILGDVSVGTNGVYNAGIMNLRATLTCLSGSSFTNNGTFNVEDGRLLNARRATYYDNGGQMVEVGTGKILRDAAALGLTMPDGTPVSEVLQFGVPFYVTCIDEDENAVGNTRDPLTITVTNLTNGDVETIVLNETGPRSEAFINTPGFPTARATATSGNGVLEGDLCDPVRLAYQDEQDVDDRRVFMAVFECDVDCNSNGRPDVIDVTDGASRDCNSNFTPDECDLAGGTSQDANGNAIPDECDGCVRPSITSPPLSQTVCAGAMVSLQVASAGTGPFVYQWRKDGVGIAGATAAAYLIAAAAVDHTASYDVIVGNACGSAVSDTATLVVWPTGAGDVNGDGELNGRDIPFFLEALLTTANGPAGLAFCQSDMDRSGTISAADVPTFIVRLLGGG